MLGSLAEAALHTGKNDSEDHMQVSRRRQRENLGMSARAAALSSAIYPPNARQGSTNITTQLFFSGGYFFKSLATAFFRFFSCFSGLALGSMVLLATPRQTNERFAESYISSANCPM